MLDRIAVGGTLSKRHGIGVADHGALKFGHQMREPVFDHILATALDVVAVKRLEVEFAEAALDMMGIDGEHGRHIVLGRGPHHDVASLNCRADARR